MTLLSDRLLEPDVVNLGEAEAAAVLNAPDPDLLVWGVAPFKDIAKVFRNTLAPDTTQVSPQDPKTAMIALLDAASTPGHVAHNVARQAVELFNRTDSPQLDATNEAERITAITLFAVLASPAAGILRPEAETAILQSLQRPQSWAEANGFPNGVTARDVGIARRAKA